MEENIPLKNIYLTRESLDLMANEINKHEPTFNREGFLNEITQSGLLQLELKEKMRQTSHLLHKFLPCPYEKNVGIIKAIAPSIKGFDVMTLPDYVEVYGQKNIELSLKALGFLTQFGSSEFAIRPFLDRHTDIALKYMNRWATDKNEHVRRLASEGCRPRLPWAMALPKFKKDPSPLLPILEKLKNDPSETVRRSVANNLNDISKDNPDVALDVCEKWYGINEQTNKIVKHACRTLLKAGNKRALILFGYQNPDHIKISNLVTSSSKIKIGGETTFSFTMQVDGPSQSMIRLEYMLFYMKANGKLSGKIFQISEKEFNPGPHEFSRKLSFKNMTTRKHHTGKHELAVVVNGEEKKRVTFELI